MFHLRLFHDDYRPDAVARSEHPVPHSFFYVFRGAATVDGTLLGEGDATYVVDYAPVTAGPEGATIWRWELVERDSPFGVVSAPGVGSRLRMARDVKMFEMVPTSKWLFRLDAIVDFTGSTGLHSHPGSGVRCLVNGHLRVESDKGEDAEASAPGDVWYEEGAYPLVTTTQPGVKTTFLRGMVLPPEYSDYADSASWIAPPEEKPTFAWRDLGQKVVTLR